MKRLFILCVLLIALVGCQNAQVKEADHDASEEPSLVLVETDEDPGVLSASDWLEDLDQFKKDLEWYSISPYNRISKETFEEAYEQLKIDMPKLTDTQREWRMRALANAIGDGHIDMWRAGQSNESLPIVVQAYEDGYYIVNARNEYASLIGQRLLSIEGVSVQSLIASFKEISNQESEYWQLAGAIDKLHHPYYYKLLGLTLENNEIKILTDTGLEVVDILTDGRIYEEEGWEKPHVIGHLSNYVLWGEYYTNKPYAQEWYEDNQLLVIRFTTCSEEDPNLKLYDFGQAVQANIKAYQPKLVLFDLRDNGGGFVSQMYEAFPESFFVKHDLVNTGRLYVATNWQTFSAGGMTANFLINQFGARHIGLPTGGSPHTTVVSSTANKILKNTGLAFRISSAEVSQKMIEQPSLVPQVMLWGQGQGGVDQDPVIQYMIEQLKKSDSKESLFLS